jgi:hemerythrin
MMKVAWDDSFSSGIEEIDSQHKEFIKLIHRLQIVSEKGSPAEFIHRMLLELAKYADYHFISEENLMIVTKCPLLERQRGEHQRLLRGLGQKIRDYEEGHETLDALIDYSISWFTNHTKEEDVKIGQHIAQVAQEQRS